MRKFIETPGVALALGFACAIGFALFDTHNISTLGEALSILGTNMGFALAGFGIAKL